MLICDLTIAICLDLWNIIIYTMHHDADMIDSASMLKNKRIIFYKLNRTIIHDINVLFYRK